MAAFQFPDPADATTVTNPITGSTYQWKEPPGKWVVTVKMRDVGDIIWEGDNPPDPIGDYKLWYSTDTLELYFYYCDAAGTCAWVPTSVPIQVLESLNEFAAQAELDISQLQYKQQLLQNAVDQIYLDIQIQNKPPKEDLPWIEISQWVMRRSNTGNKPMYTVGLSTNPKSTYTWQFEIDSEGDGTWIDIADHPQKNDLGYNPSTESATGLTLNDTSQHERYPDALMRYRFTAELNGYNSELSTDAIPAWDTITQVYSPPKYTDGYNGRALVTTRDVQTVDRDQPFGNDELRNIVPTDTIDDLLKTQEDVNDFIAQVSTKSIRKIVRTGDNIDFLQDTGGEGYFTHVAKPLGPTPLEPGTLVLLQDGGAEATQYSEVENVIMSKTGIGDYANFNSAKIGDYLILQTAEGRGGGQYVIDNITDLAGSWDLGVRIANNRAFGSFPAIDQNLQVKTTRPIWLIPSPTAPKVSAEGYMWWKSDENTLYISTRGDSDPEDPDTSQWIKVGPEDEGGADIHVGNQPPIEIDEGTLWYETYTDTLFIYVDGQWKPAANSAYKSESSDLGNFKYQRSTDQDVFGSGKLLNITGPASQPHDALTDLKIHKTSNNGIETPNDSWEPGQYISINKGADEVLYKVLEATPSENGNNVVIEVQFVELNGQPFTFFYNDIVGVKRREKLTPEELTGDYLPLTGGTVTGNVTVEGQLKVDKGNEFKLQYDDDTTMFRIQPNANQITSKASILNLKSTPGDALNGRAGLDVQVNGENPLAISNSGSYQETLAIYGYDGEAPGGRAKNLWISASGNINLEGDVNAQGFVKGSELRSIKLTSSQNSNLEIYRGSGATEDRKMLIGDKNVNFYTSIQLTSSETDRRNIKVQNGTKLYVSDENGEIITFGGSGAFYRGAISQPDHIVNRDYVDGLFEGGPFLPLTGGDMTGGIDMTLNSGTAFTITRDGQQKASIFSDGTFTTQRTEFNGNHLVTKNYVDGAIEELDDKIEQSTQGRVKIGEFVLRTTSGQPTGNANSGELTLWHLEPGATTSPPNEFKLRPTGDAEYTSQEIYDLIGDLFEGRDPVVIIKQDDKEIRFVGQGQGWITNSTTYHLSAISYSGDTLIGGQPCELHAEVRVQDALDDFYLKTGGDVHGFVRVVKPDGVALGTRPNDAADNLFQVWADGTVELRHVLKFNGSTKKIYSGSTELFDFSGNNVRIPRRGDNSIGFQLKGKSDGDDNLFNVYHRPEKDEIMYRGMINDPNAIVTKSWVEQNAGGFTPGERVAKDNSSGVEVGGFYIQNGNIFAKIS